ncbi:hypothetical protein BKA65DRAFT_403593, partial [Rhexocercosporidium sp. MPI-PUGE-AT-0058]
PPIEETVGLLVSGDFALGSFMLCKSVKNEDEESITSDIVCRWRDEGVTYYLQRRTTPKGNKAAEGDPEVGRFRFWVSSAIWNLSENIFCKVKPWTEGMTTEYNTIKWVNQNIPSLPTDEVIYHWVDVEWKRTIMISKRVPGKTYAEAWPFLTTPQKLDVAKQVAGHLKSLSEWTSDYIETVEKTGRTRPLPIVTPRVESRVPREEYEKFIKRKNARNGVVVLPPNLGEALILQHPDCNPGNFFVTVPSGPEKMPQVTGIIDWENVGYFPKYLVATSPRHMDSFFIANVDGSPPTVDNFDWKWMLSNACVHVGFPLELEYIKESLKYQIEDFPNLTVENFIVCDHLPSDNHE